MSQVSVTKPVPQPARKILADSFSKSVLLISLLMLVQRVIGFVRSFFVCAALSPAEVGQWDLAFNFLMLVAPLAVLGIPGSFGRYLPRYEHGRQQRRFLTHTIAVCLLLTLAASFAVWFFQDAVASYFFGDSDSTALVQLLAIGLPAVMLFNFATSWFTGKRLNRFVFRIQFSQTLFFALLCVVAFSMWSVTADAVVIAYLLSCLVGIVLAASYAFLGQGTDDAGDDEAEPSHSIWRKILPFAVWVWVSNALINLFSVCDRLLLVNFHPDGGGEIQSLIGQYHTACIFPLLLMTIGAMAASTGLPYLSKDWEQGNHEAVADRINLMLKAIGLFCLVASVAILLFAPIMFGQLWKNKFAIGESLLPMTLCYCSLAAMTMVGQKYFWCLEKTWISSILLLVGLATNFFAGVWLVQWFGIEGVVASTLAAHAIVLVAMLLAARRYRLRLDPGVILVAISLFTLCLGKSVAVLGLATLILLFFRSSRLLSDSERALFTDRLDLIRARLLGSSAA